LGVRDFSSTTIFYMNTQQYSVTQASNYTALAGMIVIALKYFGVDIPAESVVVVIAGGMTLYGIIRSIINRYQKGDVTISGAIK
jgi:hypothetical protein